MRSSLLCLGLLGLGLCAGCGAARSDTPPPGDALDQIEASQFFHLGNQLAEAGDSVRAEQYFSAAIERGYPEAEVIPRLMEVCIGASRLSAALGYAEPYLERHDEDWALRLLVATLQMSLNQTGAARGNLERVVVDRPDEATAHYLLGVLLRDRFDASSDANVHFTRYLELAPEGAHAREARLSIAGQYVSPAPPPAPEAREVPAEDPPPAPPSGPTRLPSHETEAVTAGGESP
jgi:tetratricopeptide (TPR) repeat protein